MRAVVLAAGSGKRLRNVFEDPKCLIQVGGVSLFGRYMEGFSGAAIEDIVLVLGYGMEKVIKYIETLPPGPRIHIVENSDFDRGSILSLWAARDWLEGDILLMDGDLYFEKDFLGLPIRSKKPDFFVIDSGAINDGEAVMVGFRGQRAVALKRGLKGDFDLCGEWAGCLRLSAEGTTHLREIVCGEVAEGRIDEGYEFVVPRLFDFMDISFELTGGLDWVEIDFPKDIEKAEKLCRSGREAGRP